MKNEIVITSDSTCDLSEEQVRTNGIVILPLSVMLGEKTYKDGIDISPTDIFRYYDETGTLPKTAAPSVSDYEDFFRRFTDEGKTVIHFNISSKASGSHGFAAAAAKEIGGGKVFVVDSLALSTGQGLLVMKACDLRAEGMDAQTIATAVQGLTTKVNTSFVPDDLNYLHKGGRCSLAAMLGAKVLKLHPLIEEDSEGQLIAKKKYMGSMERCIRTYIGDLRLQYRRYDRTRCFITHSCADQQLVDLAKREVAHMFEFDAVYETVAGAIITSHCGRNTLGVLFMVE